VTCFGAPRTGGVARLRWREAVAPGAAGVCGDASWARAALPAGSARVHAWFLSLVVFFNPAHMNRLFASIDRLFASSVSSPQRCQL
jgi:hypothetical protein